MDENRAVFNLLKDKDRDGLLKAIWDARQGEIDQIREKLQDLENGKTLGETEIKKLQNENEEYKVRLTEQEDIIRQLHKDEETSIYIIDGLKENIHSKEEDNKRMLDLLKRSKPYIQKLKFQLTDKLAEIKKLNLRIDHFEKDQRDLLRLVQEKEEVISNLERLNDSQTKSLETNIKDLENEMMAQKARYEAERESILENNQSLVNSLQEKIRELMEKTHKTEKELQKAKLYVDGVEKDLEKVRRNAKQYQILNHKMEAELYRISGDAKNVQKTRPISWN